MAESHTSCGLWWGVHFSAAISHYRKSFDAGRKICFKALGNLINNLVSNCPKQPNLDKTWHYKPMNKPQFTYMQIKSIKTNQEASTQQMKRSKCGWIPPYSCKRFVWASWAFNLLNWKYRKAVLWFSTQPVNKRSFGSHCDLSHTLLCVHIIHSLRSFAGCGWVVHKPLFLTPWHQWWKKYSDPVLY